MNARAHVKFKGRVQGVFFRANCRDFAKELGISGWVRNLPDGSVEAVFEGDGEKVKEQISRCKTKQPHARVTDVEVTWEEHKGEFKGFEIRG